MALLIQRHYISHATKLHKDENPFERFQPKARNYIRRVTRGHSEISIEEVAKEEMIRGLKEFYPILLENKRSLMQSRRIHWKNF